MRKAQQEKKEKTSVAGLVFRLSVAAASVYLVFSFVGGQMQVAEKQQELDILTAQVEEQALKNAELERMTETGDDDAYVERVAREKMGYARPDERVFVDISGQ